MCVTSWFRHFVSDYLSSGASSSSFTNYFANSECGRCILSQMKLIENSPFCHLWSLLYFDCLDFFILFNRAAQRRLSLFVSISSSNTK